MVADDKKQEYEALCKPLLPVLNHALNEKGGVIPTSALFGNPEVRAIIDSFPEKTSRKAKDVIACFPKYFTYFDKENMIANAKGYENGFIADSGELDVEKVKNHRLESKKNKAKGEKATVLPTRPAKADAPHKGGDTLASLRAGCLALDDKDWAKLIAQVTAARLNPTQAGKKSMANNNTDTQTSIPKGQGKNKGAVAKGNSVKGKGKGQKGKGSKRAAPDGEPQAKKQRLEAVW